MNKPIDYPGRNILKFCALALPLALIAGMFLAAYLIFAAR